MICLIDQRPFIDGVLDWMRRHDIATMVIFVFAVTLVVSSFIGALLKTGEAGK